MKKALRLLVFLAVFSRAVFGAESVDELKKKAEAGDATAQFNLGLMYAIGDGVFKDTAESVGNANAGGGRKRVVENDAVQHAGEMNKPSPEVFGQTKPIITDSQHQKSAEPVMRQFTYEDTKTGRTLTFVRENEPSESELEQLFGLKQLVSESRAPTAAMPAEQPFGSPIAVTDPAIKFFEKANAEADQKKVSATDSDLGSGGFSSSPHPTGRTRPTIADATRKAVELSMGGMLGVPTMSEVTQIYFRMLEEYDKSVNSVNESDRNKAFDILMNSFLHVNKKKPDANETASLYKEAATLGTQRYSFSSFVANPKGEFVGFSLFDGNTGKMMVRETGGTLREMNPNDIPATAGAFSKKVIPPR